MSEISKNIVSLIVSKEFHKAKMLIHEAMNNKLGILLEEKLLEYAPTLYEQDEEDDRDEVEGFFKKDPVAKDKVTRDPVARDTKYSSALDGDRYREEGARINDEARKNYNSGSSITDSRVRQAGLGAYGLASAIPYLGKGVGNTLKIPSLAVKTANIAANVVEKVPMIGTQAAPALRFITSTATPAAAGLANTGSKLASASAAGGEFLMKHAPAFTTLAAAVDVADYAKQQDWSKPADAIGNTSRKAAKAGLSAALYASPAWPLAFVDDIFTGGEVKDKLTDKLIDSSNDELDNMGILSDMSNPDAVKKYNNSLIGTIWPEHSVQHDADKMTADRQAERVNKRNLRKQDFEQALDQIGKPGKPPVAAGTVRTGSGQVMQK